MKKKNRKPPRRAYRNASARELASRAGRTVTTAARKARERLTRPAPPPWQDILATILAGGGAAVAGGWAVRRGLDPKIVSTAMTVGGLAAAVGASGTLRTAATSIAGAGAGQLALTLMQERAIAELKEAMAAAATKPVGDKPSNALPASSFEDRLALHSQIAEDAARFTEPDADAEYAYADAVS
jgi:hypothetical protein